MEFYRKAAPIIKDGKTIRISCDTESYLNPVGEQIVIRQLGDLYLAIVHRFGESHEVETEFLTGAKVVASYGELSGDFSAKAWIYETAL